MIGRHGDGAVLFENVNIFDGTGAERFPGSVLVRGNRIERVIVGNETIDAPEAMVVDGRGGTLMPGMVEGHAHLTWPSSIEHVVNAMTLPIEEHMLTTAVNARITLEAGFTSAYSAGSLGERMEVALRDHIHEGRLPGPRLRASALEKGVEGVMGVPEGHDPTHDRSIPGLQQYVRDMANLGVDTIKFLMSSDDGFTPGGAKILMYSEEAAQAVGIAAREAGMWLACHAQAAEAVKRAVRAGFRCIYHCTLADEEALDLLEEHRDELFVAPAPGLLYSRIHEAEDFGIDRKAAEKMGAVSGLESMERIYPEMKRRGIRVVPGGDYGFPYNPVGRNARDLQLFVDLFGYTPVEVLVAATKTAGEMVGFDVGTIEEHRLADLLLIDGDPTVDVSILQDRGRIVAVMQDGSFHRVPAWQSSETSAQVQTQRLPASIGQ